MSSVTVPVFRIGHQAARPEHFAKLTNFSHGGGRRDCDVEILETFLDIFDQVLEADILGTGIFGGFGCRAFGKNKNAHLFAAAMRQRQVPRTIWSDCLGSTPSRNETVTV